MIQVQNVTLTHKKDLRVIVEGFSLALNPGDRAVLIGEEGNGKSTLLKWLYDPQQVEPYIEASGSCIAAGERLGFLPQELPEEDKIKSVYTFFLEEPAFFEYTPQELGALAAKCHLPADFFYGMQAMATLSGGEKVKAQLLRLLLARPTARSCCGCF